MLNIDRQNQIKKWYSQDKTNQSVSFDNNQKNSSFIQNK